MTRRAACLKNREAGAEGILTPAGFLSWGPIDEDVWHGCCGGAIEKAVVRGRTGVANYTYRLDIPAFSEMNFGRAPFKAPWVRLTQSKR